MKMNDQCEKFLKLKNDLIVRLNLCYVNDENQIFIYENTFETIADFLNFFNEIKGIKHWEH